MTVRPWVAAVAIGLLASAVLTGCSDEEAGDNVRQQSPFGRVLDFSAAGPDTVFAVTDAERTCPSCAALWQWRADDERWTRVHDFPEPTQPLYDDGAGPFPPVLPESLTMAPDGQHGWFRWSNDPVLLATDDGGGRWEAAVVPWERAAVVRVLVDTPYALAVTEEDCASEHCGHQLWRTRIGSDSWTLVDWPAGASGFDLGARGGVLTVASSDSGGGYRSTDGGDSWQKVEPPRGMSACHAEEGFVSDVAVCAPDAAAEMDRLFVRPPDGTWRELPLPEPEAGALRVEWLLSGDGRTFVAGTSRGVVLTGPGAAVTRVRAPLARDDFPSPGSFVSDDVGHVLGNAHRLLRTEDGGRTWRVIAGSGAT